jgi:hypothetical protein
MWAVGCAASPGDAVAILFQWWSFVLATDEHRFHTDKTDQNDKAGTE